jgi:hypothetical protein
MSNYGIRTRTNEPHEIQKDFSEGATFAHRLFLCDAVNINGTWTNMKVIWVNDRIKRIDETATR